MKTPVQIEIEKTALGKFLRIYEVRAKKHNGETITSVRFLSESKAKETAEFLNENATELYENVWVIEQQVFL